jgi:hypothetical protein
MTAEARPTEESDDSTVDENEVWPASANHTAAQSSHHATEERSRDIDHRRVVINSHPIVTPLLLSRRIGLLPLTPPPARMMMPRSNASPSHTTDKQIRHPTRLMTFASQPSEREPVDAVNPEQEVLRTVLRILDEALAICENDDFHDYSIGSPHYGCTHK